MRSILQPEIRKGGKKVTVEERVKDLIETHCLSQAKVARSMGITDKTMSLIVNGKRRLSTAELKRFCEATQLSADLFFKEVD